MVWIPDDQWLYERTANNAARFTLGTPGHNPLVCMGLNPSTATPNDLDPTVKRVRKLPSLAGYDSFIMLNAYPQRATDPGELHPSADPDLQLENARVIADTIAGRELTVWAAWGGKIELRQYLLPALAHIIGLPELRKCTWKRRGELTEAGHPRHPLCVAYAEPFCAFDAIDYRSRILRGATP